MSNTYHFIGIKGAGMSALALMLHQMGHTVQGSDVEKYYFTQRGLEQAGIQIYPFDVKKFGKATRSSLLGMLSVQITMWKLLMQMSMA